MATTPTAPESRTDRRLDIALWVLTVVCAATTLWFSFGADPPGADAFPGADKVGHALAYFATTLSFLFAAVWRPGHVGRFPRAGMWFPAAAVAFGILIEYLQGLTPDRSPEVRDVLAEVIGAALALAVHALVRRRAGAQAPRVPA